MTLAADWHAAVPSTARRLHDFDESSVCPPSRCLPTIYREGPRQSTSGTDRCDRQTNGAHRPALSVLPMTRSSTYAAAAICATPSCVPRSVRSLIRLSAQARDDGVDEQEEIELLLHLGPALAHPIAMHLVLDVLDRVSSKTEVPDRKPSLGWPSTILVTIMSHREREIFQPSCPCRSVFGPLRGARACRSRHGATRPS